MRCNLCPSFFPKRGWIRLSIATGLARYSGGSPHPRGVPSGPSPPRSACSPGPLAHGTSLPPSLSMLFLAWAHVGTWHVFLSQSLGHMAHLDVLGLGTSFSFVALALSFVVSRWPCQLQQVGTEESFGDSSTISYVTRAIIFGPCHRDRRRIAQESPKE